MDNVTGILNRINAGEKSAVDELLSLVYQKLRAIAAAKLNAEDPNHSFQTADLVNEAYLRVMVRDHDYSWRDRGHFFSVAAEAMRRILVDHARRKLSAKRGGKATKLQLDESFVAEQDKTEEVLIVNEALVKLEEHDHRAAKLVKLRYFVGMKHCEAADAMEISRREADGLWVAAKAFLFRYINR